MTLPDEELRHLKWAGKFLGRLLDPKETPRVPRKLRLEALAVLRHWPYDGRLEYLYRLDELKRREYKPPILGRNLLANTGVTVRFKGPPKRK